MESLEINAKTVEEAIEQALEELGVSREEIEITVLSEGKHGILGLGGGEARIRVTPLTPKTDENLTEVAKDILEVLLSKMDITASVIYQAESPFEEENKDKIPIVFNIEGEDLGILIGRQGQTLTCLQYIVRLIMAHRTKSWLPIMIDVAGYKQRRYRALQALAFRIARQVKDRGIPFTLEPMSAYDRRIIHLTLADDPDVASQSTGEGDNRKVVILPLGKL